MHDDDCFARGAGTLESSGPVVLPVTDYLTFLKNLGDNAITWVDS